MIEKRDIGRAVHKSSEGIVIDIIVSPGAKKQELKGYNPWRKRIELAICSPPEKGKANQEILQFFEDLLAIKNDHINISKGRTSRSKSLLIRKGAGVDEPEVVVETILNAMRHS